MENIRSYCEYWKNRDEWVHIECACFVKTSQLTQWWKHVCLFAWQRLQLFFAIQFLVTKSCREIRHFRTQRSHKKSVLPGGPAYCCCCYLNRETSCSASACMSTVLWHGLSDSSVHSAVFHTVWSAATANSSDWVTRLCWAGCVCLAPAHSITSLND